MRPLDSRAIAFARNIAWHDSRELCRPTNERLMPEAVARHENARLFPRVLARNAHAVGHIGRRERVFPPAIFMDLQLSSFQHVSHHMGNGREWPPSLDWIDAAYDRESLLLDLSGWRSHLGDAGAMPSASQLAQRVTQQLGETPQWVNLGVLTPDDGEFPLEFARELGIPHLALALHDGVVRDGTCSFDPQGRISGHLLAACFECTQRGHADLHVPKGLDVSGHGPGWRHVTVHWHADGEETQSGPLPHGAPPGARSSQDGDRPGNVNPAAAQPRPGPAQVTGFFSQVPVHLLSRSIVPGLRQRDVDALRCASAWFAMTDLMRHRFWNAGSSEDWTARKPVRGVLPKLANVTFDPYEVSPEAFTRTVAQPGLMRLCANGRRLTSDALLALDAARALQSLTLHECAELQGPQLQVIAGLPELKHLSLFRCSETDDAALSVLAGSLIRDLELHLMSGIESPVLPHELETLSLIRTPLSDGAARSAPSCLRSLAIRIDNHRTALPPLAHCGLTELSIRFAPKLTDFSRLPHWQTLKSLRLEGTGIDDAQLGYVGQLSNLKVLSLSRSFPDEPRNIRDSLAGLSPLSELEDLDLSGHALTDDHLETLPETHTLRLRYTRVETLVALRHCKRLRVLDVEGCRLHGAAFRNLPPYLRVLHVGTLRLQEEAIDALLAHPHLAEVFLHATSIAVSDQSRFRRGVLNFSALPRMPSLPAL